MNLDGNIAVRFDRISKSIGANRVLDEVSFEIKRGGALSILGRRGAGKTLALKLCIGLLKPDSGKIFLDGEDITALNASDLMRVRKSTGYVFQNAAVFDSVSVAENIALPLRHNSGKAESEIQEIVRLRLFEVGLEGDAEKMPHYLSAGTRKLLGFARALAGEPSILLIDDPSNGVDCITAASIRNLLRDIKQRLHTTLLIVANRIDEIRVLADQFAILDNGHLIACGSPDHAMHSDNPLVAQFFSQKDV